MTTFREWRRDNSGTLADYHQWVGARQVTEHYQDVTRLPGLKAGVEHVTSAVPGKVFYSEDGTEALVLLDLDPYVVRIDSVGDTESAYLVTMSPEELAELATAGGTELGGDDIGGWSTGWTC